MADEKNYEFHNDINSLGAEPNFVDAEFTEEHSEPRPAPGKKELSQCEPAESAVEVVEGEIVEEEPLRFNRGRFVFQIYHPASGSVFTVGAPSLPKAICWVFGTADILEETGCNLWPVKGEPEMPVVPYLCWAAAAYAYCLYKRVNPDP